MYKKVTHQIIEEHFDHPMGIDIAEAVNKNKPKPKASAISAPTFKMASRTVWSNLIWRVRQFVESVSNGTDNMAALETYLANDINAIGEIIKNYYSTATVHSFVTHLDDTMKAIIDEIKAAKTNTDLKAFDDKSNAAIQSFAQFLHSINPTQWPVAEVVNVFTEAKLSWISQLRARLKKEWTVDLSLLSSLHDLMISSTGNNPPGFADAFSTGIIHQYPNDFV